MNLATQAAGGREIFIRNLPFNVTAEDLEQLCSEIGPVKRASIIQGSEGRSRGFGFVIFAVPEDAERSVASLAGSKYKGRVLSVEVALKKGQRPIGVTPPVKAGVREAQPTDTASGHVDGQAGVKAGHLERVGSSSRSGQSRGTQEAEPGRERRTQPPRKVRPLVEDPKTLLIFNLSEQTTQKQLFKRIKKVETPKILRLEKLGDSRVAIVGFETTAAARKLQKKLDSHIVHGSKLAVRRLKTIPIKTSKQCIGEQGDDGLGLHAMRGVAKREARVIVRNLSFHATPEDLKDTLGLFGPILEAEVPTVTVKGVQEKRGFGFVTFAFPEDAAKAVGAQEVMKVRGREVAVDLCLGRHEYENKRQETRDQELKGVAARVDNGSGVEGVQVEDTQRQPASQGAKLRDEDEDEEEEETDEEGYGDVETEDDDEAGLEEKVTASGEEEEGDPDPEEEGSESGGHDLAMPDKVDTGADRKCDVGEGKTIFARNVPFDATSESLKEAFKASFGQPVAFAAIVKDHHTGLSKGTAFIKFTSHKGVDAVLAVAASEGDGCVSLLGRRLKVDKAVDRAHAPVPIAAGTGRGSLGKVDRRYLYLANEGLVLPDQSAGGMQVPQGDLDKRRREQEEKKSKLRNPLFFVNPLRLSVRNLSKSVSDEELRKTLLEGARRGIQEGKVSVDDITLHLQAGAQAIPSETKVPSAEKASVRKVKVMRDLDKTPVDGVYQSRGYAFAEFTSHAYALAALRHINNNPAYSRLAHGGTAKGKKAAVSRLIVSFAVEDHRMLKKKELRVRRADATKTASLAHASEVGQKRGRDHEATGPSEASPQSSHKKVKLSRGQRQREKRRSTGLVAADVGNLQRGRQAERLQTLSEVPKVVRQAGRDARRGAGSKPTSSKPLAKFEPDPQVRVTATTRKGQVAKQASGQEDSAFASIVSQYKKKLFEGQAVGAGGAGQGASGPGQSGRSSRWFEDM